MGAVEAAREAHILSPARVQTMCVLTDALHAAGEREEAIRMLYLSALRAKSADAMLSVAVESAKLGQGWTDAPAHALGAAARAVLHPGDDGARLCADEYGALAGGGAAVWPPVRTAARGYGLPGVLQDGA